MKRFFLKVFALLPGSRRRRPRQEPPVAIASKFDSTSSSTPRGQSNIWSRRLRSLRPFLLGFGLLLGLIALSWTTTVTTVAQPTPESGASKGRPPTETLRERSTQQQKDKTRPDFALPSPPAKAPTVEAPPAGQYVLEFNRSPVVGNRFSLRGIYDEARLGFTRPHDWQINSVKALVRYRHSPALYATRSNLNVLINGTSVGSVPLNRKEGEIGTAVFDVPVSLIQNYNEITVGVLQNNSPTCTQDPYDPSLWTEILPDSKLTFDYKPQPIALNFNRYPYPLFDELSLDPNQIAYLQPRTPDETWLTAMSRFQTALGRLADYRPLETRLVKAVDEVQAAERLVVIGTPALQPALKSLKLPLALKDNQFLDDKQNVLPSDYGVLILTTTPDQRAPVLVATGNSNAGVAKAVQFLVQSQDRKLLTGQVIFVKSLTAIASPSPHDWPGYLPSADAFQLSDLNTRFNQPFADVTVRGADSPPIEIDFRAVPDEQFGSGNSMILRYSYGPQINAKTSLIEVRLDDVVLVGKRLTSVNGGTQESLKVDLPGNLIKPTSKLQVDFRLDARERRSCSRVTDQQLWGTLHSDTNFTLKRTLTAMLPDLTLLRSGFPFAVPQDLSQTTLVVPEKPSNRDLLTLLELSSRLGRLTKAESVQLQAYTVNSLPLEQRKANHLVGIGTREAFPFPEVFTANGFALQDVFGRQWRQSEVQTAPDQDGVIKEVISPWNSERVLMALSGQTETGLDQVQNLLRQDPLFFQLQGDTALISAQTVNPNGYDPNAYSLEFLRREPKKQLVNTPLPTRIFKFFTDSWFLLGPALLAVTLTLYGVVQVYLKRITV